MRTFKLIHLSLGVFVSLCVLGCSGEGYRRGADAQVYRMLEQRKRAVLDYRPNTQIEAPADPGVPRRAYAKVPVTPTSPPAPPPLEPAVEVTVPYGPLGPEKVTTPLPPVGAEGPGLEDDLADLRAGGTSPLVEGPPRPNGAVRRFGLYQALAYAADNSRAYANQTEDLYLEALDVTLERHLFSPRPFARTGAQYAGGQSDVDYRAALTATGSVGVRQQLPYGGEVVAETLVQFVSAISENAAEGESATVALSGSIPLLRGAGLVNLEPLIASERGLVYAIRAFEDFRRSFAVEVASDYFGLLAQQQSLANRRQSLTDRRALLERTRALFGAGDLTFLDVQLSEQQVLSAENQLLNAVETYQNAVDNFKVQIGMPPTEELEIVPVELELNIPDVENADVLEMAYRYRLDLQTARDQIDDARRQVANARNGLLPDLDLTGDIRVGNRGDTPARQLDSRTTTYSAGVTLDIPIDQVAERNAYRAALIAFQQSQRSFDLLRDQIAADVRSAVRGIRSAQATLEIQRRSIELAERRVELAFELLKTDEADARDVAEAQSALLEALDELQRAKAAVQIQVLQFLRDTGTLRVDPEAGAIGRAMERGQIDPVTR